MNLVDMIRSRRGTDEARSSWGGGMTFDQLGFMYGGNQYGLQTSWGSNSGSEEQPSTFGDYASRLLKGNPVVWAAVSARISVFSQARLQYRRFEKGRPQALFGDGSLKKFENPWPGGTTSDLLARMELHDCLAGNAFVLDGGDRLHMMRPDRVSIVLGSRLAPDDPASAEDVDVVGYHYHPSKTSRPRFYEPSRVAHFAPMPDPDSSYRGMSWLTPIVREVQADSGMTEHKWKFLQNAATPNLLVKFDANLEVEKVKAFKKLMESEHRGTFNAYKTLFLGGGADATVIGKDLQQIDFSNVQGKAETRIAMAAGVHPVVLGASEGLSGSSLNAGNYQAAKRSFSDIRLQHLWSNAASSLGVLSTRSDGAELCFDTSQIPFLQDDEADTADIQMKKAQAIKSLTEAGYEWSSVVSAVETDDFSRLQHTGVFSVQLQQPGASQEGNNDG